MQTVDLKLNVPVGYGVDEFIAMQKVAVMAIGGAFSACDIEDDWKTEKAKYLEEKVEC